MRTNLQSFEAFFNSWKALFDTPPDLAFPFRINAENVLYVAETPLCPFEEINLEESEVDAEELYLTANNGQFFTIEILWPFDGPPRISRIFKTQELFPVV